MLQPTWQWLREESGGLMRCLYSQRAAMTAWSQLSSKHKVRNLHFSISISEPFPSETIMIKSSKFLNWSILDWSINSALLPSTQTAHIQRMRVLNALQHPQIKLLQKKTLRKKSWPMRNTDSCCLTSAVMQGEGWKEMRDIFVWSGKQMQFLELLQKTGMKRCLLIGTVIPRNATGENWQTRQSLAEAFSGRQDTPTSNASTAHCQQLSPQRKQIRCWMERRWEYLLGKPKSSWRAISNGDRSWKLILGY